MKNTVTKVENSIIAEHIKLTTLVCNPIIWAARDFTAIDERFMAILIAKTNEYIRFYKNAMENDYRPEFIPFPKYITFSPKLLSGKSHNWEAIRKWAEGFKGKSITFLIKTSKGNLEKLNISTCKAMAEPLRLDAASCAEPYIHLYINDMLWRMLAEMSRGYSIVDLSYVLRQKRVAAMRLIPILFNFGNPSRRLGKITISIPRLQELLGVNADAYRDGGAFFAKVIKPAIEDINKCNPPFIISSGTVREKVGHKRITGIEFLVQRNRESFKAHFSCLISCETTIRSLTVVRYLKNTCGLEKMNPQLNNVISFAQEYIENDEEIYSLVQHAYTSVISVGNRYEKPVAGMISIIKNEIKRKFGIDYIAPSKRENNWKPMRWNNHYTDWQLISYDGLELTEEESARYNALFEAQKKYGNISFPELKKEADKIMAEQTQLASRSPLEFHYGDISLTKKEIYEKLIKSQLTNAFLEQCDKPTNERAGIIVSAYLRINRELGHIPNWEELEKELDRPLHGFSYAGPPAHDDFNPDELRPDIPDLDDIDLGAVSYMELEQYK